MLMELLNNPDMYVVVTFKDLEKFIMYYTIFVILAFILAEFIIGLFHYVKCKFRKKLNK